MTDRLAYAAAKIERPMQTYHGKKANYCHGVARGRQGDIAARLGRTKSARCLISVSFFTPTTYPSLPPTLTRCSNCLRPTALPSCFLPCLSVCLSDGQSATATTTFSALPSLPTPPPSPYSFQWRAFRRPRRGHYAVERIAYTYVLRSRCGAAVEIQGPSPAGRPAGRALRSTHMYAAGGDRPLCGLA